MPDDEDAFEGMKLDQLPEPEEPEKDEFDPDELEDENDEETLID